MGTDFVLKYSILYFKPDFSFITIYQWCLDKFPPVAKDSFSMCLFLLLCGGLLRWTAHRQDCNKEHCSIAKKYMAELMRLLM
jgi:hypothetical protein